MSPYMKYLPSRTSLTGTSAPTRHPGACFSFEQQILRRYDSTHCLWRYILPLFRNFSQNFQVKTLTKAFIYFPGHENFVNIIFPAIIFRLHRKV